MLFTEYRHFYTRKSINRHVNHDDLNSVILINFRSIIKSFVNIGNVLLPIYYVIVCFSILFFMLNNTPRNGRLTVCLFLQQRPVLQCFEAIFSHARQV